MKINDEKWKNHKISIKKKNKEPEKPGQTIQQAPVEETTNKGINTNQYDKTTESPQGPSMP